jgi:hypothetical protein
VLIANQQVEDYIVRAQASAALHDSIARRLQMTPMLSLEELASKWIKINFIIDSGESRAFGLSAF